MALKIAHITEAFEGGVVTYLLHVLPGQVAAGLDVALLFSQRRPQRYRDELAWMQASGVRLCQTRMCRGAQPLLDLAGVCSIRRFLLQGRFDVMHTHGFKAGALGRIAARPLTRVLTVHTPHCFPFLRARTSLERGATRAVETWLSRRTDRLVLVAESQFRAALAAGVSIERCSVVANGIPAEKVSDIALERASARRTLRLPETALVIGTCGRLVRYKATEQLLQSFSLLRKRQPSLICLVIGEGPDKRHLARQCRRLGIGDAVRFLGYRPDAAVLLAALDVLVQCAKAEGCPYAVLEAMAKGIAIVASNTPGHADIIQHEHTGMLYDYGDTESLHRALARCLENPRLRDRLGRQAREYVVQHHELTAQVTALVALYSRLCSRKRSAGNHPGVGVKWRKGQPSPLT